MMKNLLLKACISLHFEIRFLNWFKVGRGIFCELGYFFSHAVLLPVSTILAFSNNYMHKVGQVQQSFNYDCK